MFFCYNFRLGALHRGVVGLLLDYVAVIGIPGTGLQVIQALDSRCWNLKYRLGSETFEVTCSM